MNLLEILKINPSPTVVAQLRLQRQTCKERLWPTYPTGKLSSTLATVRVSLQQKLLNQPSTVMYCQNPPREGASGCFMRLWRATSLRDNSLCIPSNSSNRCFN